MAAAPLGRSHYKLAYGEGGVRMRLGKGDRGDLDARGSGVGFVRGLLFDRWTGALYASIVEWTRPSLAAV